MVSHVVVGYSAGLLGELDGVLPERSVLVVEEPRILAARGVTPDTHRCLAEVRPAATQDEERCDALPAAVPRPPGARAVLPGGEYGVLGAAVLAQAWGLAGGGPAAARLLRDKARLRQAAARREIAQPEWAPAGGPADVERFLTAHGGRCVLKPANRQASLGVQLLAAGDDIAAAWRHTAEADEPGLRVSHESDGGGPDSDGDRPRFLVEELLTGPEVSVEALVRDGRVGFLNVTAKQVAPGRYPVELGHTVPAPLPGHERDALREATAELVAAVGFDTGVLHAEWILVGSRPHLVECAGRLPGDRILTLIDLAHGGSLLRRLLVLLEGGDEPAGVDDTPAAGAAAIRFLTVPPGTVASVAGQAAARSVPGVHELRLSLTPGDVVPRVTNSWQRAGHAIAVGQAPKEAAARADEAIARIAIAMDDAHTRDRGDGGGVP